MTHDELIKRAAERFLCWKLPVPFSPDNGISFTPPTNPDWWPVGTNLLDADQAKAMFEHCLAPQAAPADEIDRLKNEEQALRKALELSVQAMRAPFDGWKGELERKALDAARAALGSGK